MRFAKSAVILGLCLSLTSLSVIAQEEFIEDVPPPPTDGLFDDELEPLDEIQPAQPAPVAPTPHSENGMPSGDQNQADRERDQDRGREVEAAPSYRSNPTVRTSPSFPSTRPVTAPKGKALPDLPDGISIPNSNEKLRMDFVQVEIEEIVKFFAERMKKRFIYDPSMLSGKITIVSPSEVTLREAWGAFLSALEVRGYIVFPAGPFLKLEKAANARKAPVPVHTMDTPNDDSFVTRIITLKFLSVNDIRQAVRNLLSRTAGDVIEHAPTNTLIISDYAFNIRRIVRILNILDVEGFQEQIVIIPLKQASATDMARKVTEFFPTGNATGGSRVRTRSATASPSTGGVGEGAAASVVQKVVADERTNSLIVLGSERGIEQVRRFIEQMDVPVEGGGGQIHVYYLQNVKAEDISQTLASLTSGTKSKSGAGFGGVPPGAIPAGAAPAAPGAPTTATLLGGEVKITADAPTNSLVIQASPRDFDVLKSIIRKLDIRRRQVFIESAILEASVQRGSTFGTQASGPFAKTGVLGQQASGDTKAIDSAGVFSLGSLAQSLDGLLADPSKLTGLALGFRSGGTYTISTTDSAGNTVERKIPLLSAIIRLAAENRDLNVLSTPHVLATANEEANISIGEEVSAINSDIRSEGGTAVTRNYTRINVATELNITPQINSGDYLTLKIKQKVNSIKSIGSDGQPNTIKREASTTAIVKDSQTIVIGGLMEDRKIVTTSKVPFLGDIPVLGWLFKSRSSEINKVNLLLFLTPHIIKDTGNMNDTFFKKLKEREKYLQELGIPEQKNVPISGLSDEQKQMLDPDYLKSLRQEILTPLPQSIPEMKESESNSDMPVQGSAEPTPLPSSPAPSPSAPLPVPAPAPAPESSAPALPTPIPHTNPENPSEAHPEMKLIEPSPDLDDAPLDDGMERPPLRPQGA